MSLLNLLEEFIMFEKIRKMKNKKGFTLVELIVVLVILAILAALLIPALTGYIDKANQEKVVAETRMIVMAVQTEASTYYGTKGSSGAITAGTLAKLNDTDDASKAAFEEIVKLAEVKGLGTTTSFTATVGTNGAVTSVTYYNGTYVCTYTASTGSYSTPTKTNATPQNNTLTIA